MTSKEIWILVLALLSYLVIAIDGSIVFTGLTDIAHTLGLNQVQLSWVQNAYVIAFGGFLLLGGKLGDAYGRKIILNVSLIVFGLGSVGTGLAFEKFSIIISRFIQGVGAALMAPAALALIMDYFTGPKLVKAVAWYSSVSGIGMCFGLLVGGAVTDFLSWRYGFFLNVPLVILMLWITWRYVDRKPHEKSKFDFVGAVVSVLAIFSLSYAVDGAKDVALWLVIGFVLLSMFILIEKRVANPVMPLSLFASAVRSRAYLTRAFFIGSMMGFNFFISEFMQIVLHYSPFQTGMGFIPMTLLTFVAALLVPKAVIRFGNRRTLVSGLIFLLIGFGGTLFIQENSIYIIHVAIPMVFIGFGCGLAMSPTTNMGIENVSPEDSGVASGVVNAAHQIGGAIGLAVMIFAGKHMPEFTEKLHMAMIVAFGCVLLALCISIIKKV